MKLRHYAALAGAAFILGLVLRAPAASLYAWFTPTTPPPTVQLLGLQGQLLDGRLAGVTSQGRLAMSELHWRFKPLWLLLARAAFHVEGGGAIATIDGHLAVLPTGTLKLSSFRINGAVKRLLAATGYPLPVDGQASLEIGSLKLKNGLPSEADAHAEVHGLLWTLARDPVPLGDFQADVQTEGDTVLVLISTISGPLDLSGEGKLLADHSYELNLQLKPKADATPVLQNLVRSLGQPDTQGYWHIKRQGSGVGAVP